MGREYIQYELYSQIKARYRSPGRLESTPIRPSSLNIRARMIAVLHPKNYKFIGPL